jgi:glycosyltransferase involved in cell wall biosynthesis
VKRGIKVENTILSICLITYNQANYIKQSIESILIQKTSFDWKLIIADDFSTDGTREILLEYKERFPESIRLILQKENVGPARNFIDLITKPESKYIAYLEGDDYWTSPFKLQKQVDFLESNTGVFGCFHDVVVVDENNNLIKNNYYQPTKEIFNQVDSLTYGSAYCTGSLMFRSSVLKNIPKWFLNSPSDYAVDLLITEFGLIAHINENLGAYRIHKDGTWQGNLVHKNQENVIERYKICLTNPKFKKKYGSFFYSKIGELSGLVALHYQKESKFFKKIKYSWFFIYYSRPRNIGVLKYALGILLFPSFYKRIKHLFLKQIKNVEA